MNCTELSAISPSSRALPFLEDRAYSKYCELKTVDAQCINEYTRSCFELKIEYISQVMSEHICVCSFRLF